MPPECPTASTPIEKLEYALLPKLDRGNIELPLLPQVASQVMALTSDPAADAAKLSSLIHQDQALAAHVLRIANSLTRTRRVNVESAFLCGLLHGIGKPVVLRMAATVAHEQRIRADTPMLRIVIDGYDSRVGCLIAEKRGLPKQIVEVIQLLR
ncbi:MAG: HDOD domain-containing protein [Nitrospira sp.]|nr:HDOD domain-containing protein [Nitrospira sp.]MDH5254240.1 HDOD domain-containing protein [Nitrospira sp.]MDH5626160.1 HDOD domain-containing protein [Nitrospira sp.]